MLLERYLDLPKAISVGATCSLPETSQKVADKLLPRVEYGSFNPLPEDLLSELDSVIGTYKGNITVSGLKRDLNICRADIMIYFASFTDLHNLKEVNKISAFSSLGMDIVSEIENTHKDNDAQLSVAQQLDLALAKSEGDLTKAVLALAIGTRAMARGADNRIMPDMIIDEQRMMDWKRTVKAFAYGEGSEDAGGDTYHFWHAVLCGMSREEKADIVPTRLLKQTICDVTYGKTALATELLRYNLCKKSGKTHNVLDTLGYEVGRAFMNLYDQEKLPDSV